jgi:biopolymer transport protein ExbD
MAIFAPGKKFRNHRLLSRKNRKRDVIALLSLTAMVDMFTVLAIFLLQNYNTEGLIVNIPKDIQLPKAHVIKELKPAVVITVSQNEVKVDDLVIATFAQVKDTKDWMIQPLYFETQKAIEKAKAKVEKSTVLNDVRTALRPDLNGADEGAWKKVTVQADKEIDFLTVKKVLYTLTEAGAGEINFAVIKRESPKQ